MKQHITRHYNSFDINKTKGIITKISSNEKLRDEIEYYKSITDNNSIYFPRYMGSNYDGENYALDLEYYCYKNLGDFMIYEPFDLRFWEKTSESIQDMMESFSQNSKTGNYNSLVDSMYVNKTEHYYKELVDGFKLFTSMSKFDTVYFNGVAYLNFENIWDDVKKKVESFDELDSLGMIHGDFCFSNILCGVSEKINVPVLRCVDPRGSFGEQGIYGDRRYDLAKLMHSYQGGYEYIIYDEFKIEKNGWPGAMRFDSSFSNQNLNKIEDVFKSNSYFYTPEIKLLQGLIFIGMCSRHYDSLDRQTLMYLQGIKFLNEALNDE